MNKWWYFLLSNLKEMHVIAIRYHLVDDSVDRCLDTVYTRMDREDWATRLRRIERQILTKEIAQGRVHPPPSHFARQS